MPFVVGIEGGYGAGKTLTSAIKAQLWANQTGATMFSNFRLREAVLFEHFTDWYRVAHCHGSIIIFDESQRDWDNRRWSGSKQIDKTLIMNYVRKMNSIFVFVLPDFDNVDSRVRQMCEILIHVERLKNGTMMNKVYDYTDKRFGENGRLIKTEYLSWEKQKQIFKLNLYNTSQMVNSFPMPDTQEESDDFFRRLDAIHDAAVKREYPDRPEIAVRLKEDLNFEELWNPNPMEVIDFGKQANPEPISISTATTSKGPRKRRIPSGESILI